MPSQTEAGWANPAHPNGMRPSWRAWFHWRESPSGSGTLVQKALVNIAHSTAVVSECLRGGSASKSGRAAMARVSDDNVERSAARTGPFVRLSLQSDTTVAKAQSVVLVWRTQRQKFRFAGCVTDRSGLGRFAHA
jgi:hypothetical protein